MKWFWEKEYGPEVTAYREANENLKPAKKLVSETRFTILDIEATGFKAEQDRILSLATVDVKDGRLSLADMGSWVVFHSHVRMNTATSIHGIMPQETAAGLDEKTVMKELLERLAGTIIVGHHIGFDVAMINHAMRKHFGAALCNPTVDTGKLAMASLDAFAKTGYPGQRDPSLDEVCAMCEIPPVDRHTAEGDAFTTATLFMTLCLHLQRRKKRPLILKDLPIVGGL